MKINDIKKYLNFRPEAIKGYLEDLRKDVQKNNYSIALNENRQENVNFIEDYKIDTNKEKDILLSLTYKDFCYAVDNRKEEYSYEILYVFCKQRELDYWGTLETVDIYIKTNMTETSRSSYLFIVSFHKRNKPITFLFKNDG